MNVDTLRPIAQTLLRSYEVRSARSSDLASAIVKGKLTSWSDGKTLCTEGEPSDDMYIILKGNVRIVRNDANGVARELAVLKAPTMIGQMGLVDGSLRSATCVAQGKVGAITINIATFRSILEEANSASSAFRHLLLASMNKQLFTANGKIRQLIEDIEKEEQSKKQNKKSSKKQAPTQSSSDRLMEIAGVLDGWKMDSSGVDDVEFVEDDDMKRTREARGRKKRF